jgi:hypothetical protein
VDWFCATWIPSFLCHIVWWPSNGSTNGRLSNCELTVRLLWSFWLNIFISVFLRLSRSFILKFRISIYLKFIRFLQNFGWLVLWVFLWYLAIPKNNSPS